MGLCRGLSNIRKTASHPPGNMRISSPETLEQNHAVRDAGYGSTLLPPLGYKLSHHLIKVFGIKLMQTLRTEYIVIIWLVGIFLLNPFLATRATVKSLFLGVVIKDIFPLVDIHIPPPKNQKNLHWYTSLCPPC